MDIKQYTVVSCNECEDVWIVKDKPETSKCPTCGKARKFKLLKKYKSVDVIEKARLIRAKVKASIADNDEEFGEAIEEGEIIAGDDAFTTGSRFDNNSSKSFKDVVKDAIEEKDTVEEIKEYCEEHDYDGSRAERYIDKKKQQGEIIKQDGSLRFI